MCLGAACFAGVILGCFAIDYIWTARDFYKTYTLKELNSNMLTALLILLIIGVILLFFNAVMNVFRKRASHFILGAILIVWVFVFVCILGLVLRDLRKRQFNKIEDDSHDCASILDSYHQDDIKGGCSQKYLTTSCTK